jgi:hypothetical protein
MAASAERVIAGVADVADACGFAMAFGDLLAAGVVKARAVPPLAVFVTPIVADAAAPASSALPTLPRAALRWPAGCALSESWLACGWPPPASA